MNKPRKLIQAQRERLTRQLKEQLAQHEEIIFSYLHGSFVEGGYFRDVDIAVYVDQQAVPEDKALEYALKLSTALESGIPLTIDVRVLNYTPIGFKYHVTTGKVLTCRDDDLRVEVVARIWSIYFDYLPTLKRFLKEMVER